MDKRMKDMTIRLSRAIRAAVYGFMDTVFDDAPPDVKIGLYSPGSGVSASNVYCVIDTAGCSPERIEVVDDDLIRVTYLCLLTNQAVLGVNSMLESRVDGLMVEFEEPQSGEVMMAPAFSFRVVDDHSGLSQCEVAVEVESYSDDDDGDLEPPGPDEAPNYVM